MNDEFKKIIQNEEQKVHLKITVDKKLESKLYKLKPNLKCIKN